MSTNGYNSNIAAFYTEADILFSKKLVAKVGFRLSNNSLLDETTIAPRASIAYKVSKNSQFSFAYGDFTQTPRWIILNIQNTISLKVKKQDIIF